MQELGRGALPQPAHTPGTLRLSPTGFSLHLGAPHKRGRP